MSNATKSSPPLFEEGVQTWKEYKKELMMWKTLTSLASDKLGPALYLALKGKAKEVIKDIDIAEIATEGGLDKIIEALDGVFKKDQNQEAYLAYKTFEEYKRQNDMKVKDYIIKFESLHAKLKSLQIELPEGVKAYRLLHSANMSDDEMRLCLATIKEFKYSDMKIQLMKICGDEVSCSNNNDFSTMSIKEEPVFLSENSNRHRQHGNNRYDDEHRFNNEQRYNDEHIFRNDTDNTVYYAENQGNRFNNRRPNRWISRPGNQYNRGNRRGGGNGVRGRGYVTPKGELNPVGHDGAVSKCVVCGSKYHWKNNCPEIQYNVESKKDGNYKNTNIVGVCESIEKEEEINLYNVLQTSGDELDGLIGETIGMAVVDSGCSKTVAGKQWFELFKDTMEEEELKKLTIEPSQQLFKFGEGKSVKSEGKVKLPALIGSKNVTIETEIIKANIPMLLSKESMKSACTVINFNTDQIQMLGETQKLISTTSGHYAIPLTKSTNSNFQTSQNHIALIVKYTDDAINDPKKIADKLHRQFCHCSAKRLKQLIRNSELWKDDKILLDAVDKISENCQICKRYKKSPSIPVVGLPLASNFMDCVAMDLFVVHGKIILHLIDIFTRYSVAVARNSKSQNSIVDAIMKAWISYFGKPQKFIADNGGEFNNATYRDMCDLFEIEILKTAAYSPWSNGLCERHNGVLEESIKKTIEDTGCSVETATVWSVSAKNTLCNQSGYSSNQMVFGRNPNFPSVLNDKLPGLSCDGDLSYTVEDNLKAMRAAREACIKAESSDKLKRALQHNVPSYNNEHFEIGQKVYYKRKDTRWSGPANVIGRDGKTVIVKHGGEMIRVHISRLVHVDKNQARQDKSSIDDSSNSKENESEIKNDKNGKSNDQNNMDELDSDSESDKENENENELSNQAIVNRTNTGKNDKNEQIPVEDEQNERNGHEIMSKNNTNQAIIYDQIQNQEDERDNQAIMNTEYYEEDQMTETNNENDLKERNTEESIEPKQLYPDLKSHIMYKTNESSDWKKGLVMSRAGKVGKDKKGKHRAKYNIQDEKTSEITHCDFDSDVCEWMPISSKVMLTNTDKTAKVTAKNIELQSWKRNNVYTEVNDDDQYAITTRWIMTTKEINGDFTVKARLVARGFEDIHNQGQNDSPTCAKDSIRIALNIMASKQWRCMSLDVKTAFLQSYQLEREIFLVPPKEANTDKLWKLNKAVYGLNEASRQWYNRVSHELMKMGMKRCKYDEALFYLQSNGSLIGIITVHVDDFLFGGTNQFHEIIIAAIKSIFEIGRICVTPLIYLGLSINQTESEITINQNEYISSLQEAVIVDSKDNDRLLSKDEHKQYRRLCGRLNWISTQTRPDIAFDVAMISANVNAPTMKHLKMANKTIRKVKSTSFEIVFCKLQDPIHLFVYCDASYANLPNGGSQGGQIVFVSDENGFLSPLTWTSKKVRRVCRSTISAETMSLLDAVDTSIWIMHILEEVTGNKSKKAKIKTDSKSLYDAAHSTTAVEEKRLRVDIAAIREEIRQRTILVDWIPKTEQLADVLTKQGANRESLINVLKNSHL
jgi:transposase InsO family protein